MTRSLLVATTLLLAACSDRFTPPPPPDLYKVPYDFSVSLPPYGGPGADMSHGGGGAPRDLSAVPQQD